MNLLLDTHVILWQLSGEQVLAPAAVDAIRSADELFVSAVSFAEIGIKSALGKLDVHDDPIGAVLSSGVRFLPLSAEHGLAVGRLPVYHRDPFDRLLIAQARAEGMTLITADARIAMYDVHVINAR